MALRKDIGVGIEASGDVDPADVSDFYGEYDYQTSNSVLDRCSMYAGNSARFGSNDSKRKRNRPLKGVRQP